jgi:SAM-dependent methyltransferase
VSYLLQSSGEPARIRAKTEPLLVRHHLDWAGLKPGESFVDFGCASGEVMCEAAQVAGADRIVGIDADGDALEYARAEALRLGLIGLDHRKAWVDDPGSSGLESDRYDHAWARFFLEYHARPLEAIREMTRVVRPGGKVTLIDIDGNCIWHFPLPRELERRLAEVLGDLRRTGFDPRIGSKLRSLASRAGLVGVRESVEPHHRILGAPDEPTADAWRRKLGAVKAAYERLMPGRASRARALDDLLAFIMRDDTMTWSLLHLVQGTKPDR